MVLQSFLACVMAMGLGLGLALGMSCGPNWFRDPSTALVGFSWDAADEKKARSSFSLGRKDFGLFYDVQKLAAQLGYSEAGLGRLCEAILGLDLPKPKHVRASFLLLNIFSKVISAKGSPQHALCILCALLLSVAPDGPFTHASRCQDAASCQHAAATLHLAAQARLPGCSWQSRCRQHDDVQ